MSEAGKETAPVLDDQLRGHARFGAPSVRLFLIRLRPRRAELRFARQKHHTKREFGTPRLDALRGIYQPLTSLAPVGVVGRHRSLDITPDPAERDFQCLRDTLGDGDADLHFASFNRTDVGPMDTGAFCERLLRDALLLAVLTNHLAEQHSHIRCHAR